MYKEGIPYLSVEEEAQVWVSQEPYISGRWEDVQIDAESVPFVCYPTRFDPPWLRTVLKESTG